MSLEDASNQLGWPTPNDVLTPRGAGPAIYAQLARQKIQQSIQRLPGGQGVRVGVLMRDPNADATEEPLAIVCDFPSGVPPFTLEETHRLAWNFCRSKVLVVLEPHLVRAFTCCEAPSRTLKLGAHPAEVHQVQLSTPGSSPLATQIAASLHWLQLVSGNFIESHPTRFPNEGRADQTLLENLRSVRAELLRPNATAQGLGPDVIHDLLARIIFIQFLFDRKDQKGRPALGQPELRKLSDRKILSDRYTTFGQILRNYRDAYGFFRWLNSKFNGDLFPGKGATKAQQESEWRAEMQAVQPSHLNTLALFVDGTLKLKGRSSQLCLWPLYSFDAIPLEFISSIYEVFVGGKPGVHYTRGYLVDFILDGVLPWESNQWDLRVLDPACGSGIFLVKVFQRLVHRWRRAHPNQPPRAALLKRIVLRNLFGIDIDPHAVRVASFSLYLAMCDQIDPRHCWNQMRFPELRGQRLISADFFDEREGFQTAENKGRYDIVLGNAPWGQGYVTASARAWASAQGWSVVNQGIGTIFLAKAAMLASPTGRVAMITSASALLFNRETTAEAFRRKLFVSYCFEEVINLSAIRFGLFPKAKSAACILVFQPVPPTNEPFLYICPKPLATGAPGDWIVIEPRDVQEVYPDEAASDSWVWTALLWGGRRDLDLVRRLSRRPRLDTMAKGIVHKRKGIVRGNRLKPESELVNRRILGEWPTAEGDVSRTAETPEFPNGTFLRLQASSLPVNLDSGTENSSSTTMTPFELPQLIIKKSWTTGPARFRAVLVEGDALVGGVVCTQSYVSVHVPEASRLILDAACLSLNSLVAVYYLFLTSGRGASFIPEALVEELLSVPMPPPTSTLLDGLTTFHDVDVRARQAFGLNDAEWILVEDFARHTIPQIQDAGSAAWRKSGGDDDDASIEDLIAYCECFIRVLGTMGTKSCAVVFQRPSAGILPVDLVALHLNHRSDPTVQFEDLDDDDLWSRLDALNRLFLSHRPTKEGGVFFQRTARVYDTPTIDGMKVATVYIIKPRASRYWTRSTALRDADEVVADAAIWSGTWNLNSSEQDHE